MDPTICYEDMLTAMQDENYDVLLYLAGDLQAWLEKGGCYPVGYDKKEVDNNIGIAIGLLTSEDE